MLNAYVFKKDGTADSFETLSDLAALNKADCTCQWIDIEAPTNEELAKLSRIYALDESAIEDSLLGDQRPRIDEFEEQAFFLLYGAIGSNPDSGFSPRKVTVFLANSFIITIHAEPLKSIDTLRSKMNKRMRDLLHKGTDTLLFMLIDSMVDNYLLITDQYEAKLEVLEDLSLEAEPNPEVLTHLLDLRKDMLELRRLATTHREIIQPLITGELSYISTNIEKQFLHVRDHLTTAIETIDNLRELLHGVRDNYHASLAMRTNTIMQTLTIFASIFLPLSFIAGLYGMNTALWPSVDSPYSFWVILATMSTVAMGMLLFFKRKKWF